MTIVIRTPFGEYRVSDPQVVPSAMFGTSLEGWTTYSGELWPDDMCLHSLDRCESWEIV